MLSDQGELGLGFEGSRGLLEPLGSPDVDPISQLAADAIWSVTYHLPWDVPVYEYDLWIQKELPTGPGGAIPCAIQFGPKRRVRRASAKMLAFFEGVFRALAETTEDELDSGAWSKTVTTCGGPLTLQLSLPDVLDPATPAGGPPPFNPLRMGSAMEKIQELLEQQSFESEDELRAFLDREVTGRRLDDMKPEGPRKEDRALAIEAMDTPGRRGVAMARKALKLDPESPVAHLAVAIHSRDPDTAVERFREAVAVAERELGPEIFTDGVGSFWAIPSTRTYMEARKGLGDVLSDSGRVDEAVEHYADLIRLNPNDNQGIRDRLVPAYLELGDDAAAAEVLDQFPDDPTAAAMYNRALLAYRRSGDTEESRMLLDSAIETNRFLPGLLLGLEDLPGEMPTGYVIGSFEEAALHCVEAVQAWKKTPGALEWLEDALGEGDHDRR